MCLPDKTFTQYHALTLDFPQTKAACTLWPFSNFENNVDVCLLKHCDACPTKNKPHDSKLLTNNIFRVSSISNSVFFSQEVLMCQGLEAVIWVIMLATFVLSIKQQHPQHLLHLQTVVLEVHAWALNERLWDWGHLNQYSACTMALKAPPPAP